VVLGAELEEAVVEIDLPDVALYFNGLLLRFLWIGHNSHTPTAPSMVTIIPVISMGNLSDLFSALIPQDIAPAPPPDNINKMLWGSGVNIFPHSFFVLLSVSQYGLLHFGQVFGSFFARRAHS
jgi:hypothetical protein